MSKWFEINLKADGPADAPSVAEVYVNDYIGGWADQVWKDFFSLQSPLTAKDIIDQLSALPESVKSIRVHINSPGGDVSAAVMIANALRDQRVTKGRTVETIVDGLAASAASVIAMAGSPLRMADNAILMIHDPWSVVGGNAAELRKTADVLDQIRNGSIIPTYQWHSQKSVEEIAALMAAETWMDADMAIEQGFADEKIAGLKAAASIDPRAITALNIPEKFADRVKALMRSTETPAAAPVEAAPAPAPAPKVSSEQIVKACAEAGLDLAFASSIMAESLTADALSSRIAAEKGARIAAETRASNIRALCGKAHEDLVPDLVASAMSFDQVKAHMAKVLSKLDKVEIDAGLAPENGKGKKPALTISAIYAELNRAKY